MVKPLLFSLFIAIALISSAQAQEVEKKQPAFISAENVHYNQETQTVTAEGKVEIIQDDRILLCDKLIYDQGTNRIRAEGNISVLEASGDVFFGNKLELTDNMKRGIIEQFRARFADNSLLAATKARRPDENTMIMHKAVYSPCPVCREGPDTEPLWQLKADQVKIDNIKQRVTYDNAFFEVKGVPVLYTPYFSHATPNAKQTSGFLMPTYRTESTLGNTIQLPYYLALTPSMDATITPILASKESPVLLGQFRQLTTNGGYEFNGSVTNPVQRNAAGDEIDGHEFRGHIQGKGQFDLKDDWDWGFDINRASDDTYMRRYNFGDEDSLTSRVFAEQQKDRNYHTIQALSFQGLQADYDSDTSPWVTPYAKSHWEGLTGFKQSRWSVDSNILSLSRNEGIQSRRLSVTTSWNMPHITRNGHVLDLRTSVRGDAYSLDMNSDTTNAGDPDYKGVEGRAIPEAELDWSYPLVRQGENARVMLTPVVNTIVSPYGNNPNEIPNEDSRVTELSDENLFSPSKFTGIDRVESGPRVNYGIRADVQGNKGQNLSMLVGQSYRTRTDANFTEYSGLDDNMSDYVGRIVFRTREMLDLGYRFRLDKDSMDLRRSEVNAGLYIAPVRFNVDYISLDDGLSPFLEQQTPREEIYSRIGVDLNKEWSVIADARRDLSGGGGFVSASSGLLYNGECANIATTWVREFTRDRDIEPSSSFTVQILLKNLN